MFNGMLGGYGNKMHSSNYTKRGYPRQPRLKESKHIALRSFISQTKQSSSNQYSKNGCFIFILIKLSRHPQVEDQCFCEENK